MYWIGHGEVVASKNADDGKGEFDHALVMYSVYTYYMLGSYIYTCILTSNTFSLPISSFPHVTLHSTWHFPH